MKTRFLPLIVMFLCAINAWAQSIVKVDGIYYDIDRGIVISSQDPEGYSGDIVIPEFVEDGDVLFLVVGIDDRAFANSMNLTSVNIEAPIDHIGSYAFFNCEQLQSVSIRHLETIGDYAFANCGQLQHVLIGGLVSIGEYAFSGCAIYDFQIPLNVESIGTGAFADNYLLFSVYIPENVTAIGPGAFSDCEKLTDIEVSSHNSVYSTEDGVLFDKEKTLLHTFPVGKKGDYTIPNTVVSIADYAFYKNQLASIILPENLTEIGQNAFYIDTYFDTQNITVLNPVPVNIEDKNVFNELIHFGITLTVPAAGLDKYRQAPVWKNYELKGGDHRVSALSNNHSWGSVSGNVILYPNNGMVSLKATPADGYRLVNWTVGNVEVSRETTYEFSITSDVDLVANFEFVSCPDPTLTIMSVTKTEAHLSWSAGGSETGWNLIVSDTEITDWENIGSPDITHASDTTLTGLISGINYYVYFRAYCSEEDQSDWIIRSFRTKADCDEAISSFPWTESFEDNSPSRDCWTTYKLDVTGGFSWSVGSAEGEAHSGSKYYLHQRWSSPGGSQHGWLVTPQLSIPASEQYVLTYWTKNGDLHSGVWISTGGNNPRITGQQGEGGAPLYGDYEEKRLLIGRNGEISSQYKKLSIPLDDYAGQAIYVGFRYLSNGGESWCVDDVEVRQSYYFVSPAANSKNVPKNATISIRFESEITADDLSKIMLWDELKQESISVQASISGRTLQITHPELRAYSSYTVVVPTGSIREYNDEIFSWSFTTADVVTGTTDPNTKELCVYSDKDQVIISGLQENATFGFYTTSGQLISSHRASGEIATIPVNHLSSGIYFVKTNHGKVLKWIKK